ncbi:hypothetical protein Sste5346_005241 [Sporothrix stenoceras]|uniref:U1-type domain-containing protein n=1 Tax=Sporothrix stenoceras TaxID=5173 RepID=A0ABR3Z482_9PEZI
MADYWKSTPKYWCKHCAVYVTDTKLGRANHEATGKHQSAVRRALRNLHRDHEREEREKDRAKREVERLNSLVGEGGASSSIAPTQHRARPPPPPQNNTQPQPSAGGPPREQLEQLAELGVSIPDEFRPELAMAGDWTVTETRVVAVEDEQGNKVGGDNATRSVGVRKRPRGSGQEDDDEQKGHSEFEKIDLDAAVQGLFKKPRQWGRDPRTAGSSARATDPAEDLDSLLNSALAKPVAPKKEEQPSSTDKASETKEEIKNDIKEDGAALDDRPADTAPAPPTIKQEVEGGSGLGLDAPPADTDEKPETGGGVVFKKRKTKTVRQR